MYQTGSLLSECLKFLPRSKENQFHSAGLGGNGKKENIASGLHLGRLGLFNQLVCVITAPVLGAVEVTKVNMAQYLQSRSC